MSRIPRRAFLRMLAGAATATACAPMSAPSAARTPLYIGTYTRGRSRGIYSGSLDLATGAIALDQVTEGIENPSYLALSSDRRYLYAVSEVGSFGGTRGGGVVAYATAPDGSLRELSRQASHGGAPCYLSLAPDGRFVLVANYSGGNAALLPVQADGSLAPAVQVIQHEGRGPNAQRQEAAHAHWIGVDPAGTFAFIVDLGIDRVAGYHFDASRGRLDPAEGAGIHVRPGAGPRHLDFHPDGDRAYVINELDSTLTAVAYDATSGSMVATGTASTLPGGFSGTNSCADVHVHPSGRFVYGSNRGHDSVAVFAIEGQAIVPVQHQPTLGRTPRNFAITPDGRWLVAANQDSDSLAVFSIDDASGRLTPVGQPVDAPVPVCVRFG